MVKGKYVLKGNFCRKRLEDPKKFEAFWTLAPNPNVRIVIGCPKGKMNRKTGRCRVPTVRQAILRRPVKGKCPPK